MSSAGQAASAPCQAPGHEFRLLGPLGLAGRAGADPSTPEGHVLGAQDVHVQPQGRRQPLQPPQALSEAAGLAAPDKPHLGIEGPELLSAPITRLSAVCHWASLCLRFHVCEADGANVGEPPTPMSEGTLIK